MQWSRLKSLVEARFADALRRRVSLHQARYRHAREEVGRVWIAIDGRDAASFATGATLPEVRAETERLLDGGGAGEGPAERGRAAWEAVDAVRRAGVYSDRDALAELEAYLSLPIEAALAADSPLQRALAMLDARVGKRRLRALCAAPDAHPLVRTALALRCEAEGIASEPSDA